MGCFVENQRGRNIRNGSKLFTARILLWRKESEEHELVGRESGSRESGDGGIRSRYRDNRNPALPAYSHEAITGIRNGRRPRIGNQRNRRRSRKFVREFCGFVL